MPIAAQPLLEEVSRTLDESTSVAVLEEGSVVFVARSATRRIMSVDAASRQSCAELLHGARSRAARSSRARRAHDATRGNGFPGAYQHTVPSRKKLDDILSTVRRQGYALNDQELEIGLRSIAVPVRNVVGEVVAAMNVGAQASRVSLREMVDTFLPVLRSAADRLGGQLPPTQ